MSRRFLLIAVSLFPAALAITGLVVDGPQLVWEGLGRIIVSPSILLHDYLVIGGLGATLVNGGLLGLVCCAIVWLLGIDVNGPFIAAIYTVIGFAFFGKNVLNIWPILIGVAIFARVQGVSLKNYALVAMFGTTLGPLVSALAFGGWLEGWLAFVVAGGFGLIAGFVLPPLASHMLRFHDGYNIYNIGFTGGIVGSFMAAVLRSFDFSISAGSAMATEYNREIQIILYSFFALAIITGLVMDLRGSRSLTKHLKNIHASSGRLVADFTTIGDHAATFVNVGVMGLLSCAFVLALGGDFNGPVVGGILTVVGFGAFGKHSKNCLPIFVGVVIAGLVTKWDITGTPMIIAGLFGTTLAPIAGQYGSLAGVVAGFFHVSIVHNVGVLHGGMNLYNNGFAGGFVASFLVPIFDALQKDKEPA